MDKMSSDAERLLDEAMKLDQGDRAALALRLLDSIGEAASDVERVWIEEAERRLVEIQRGEVQTVPWPEARARIFAR
jgi:putative addiction module component (TIGR02574 family)